MIRIVFDNLTKLGICDREARAHQESKNSATSSLDNPVPNIPLRDSFISKGFRSIAAVDFI
ncbi:unnamed protein product [Acidithrix sp. C25]|nr:unnamed protein product [Acidithrix sp. C25]